MTDAAFAPLSPDETASRLPVNPPVIWVPIAPIPDDAEVGFPSHRLGKPSQWWVYKDAEGHRLMAVCRLDQADGGKTILPLTYCQGPDGCREWRWQSLLSPRPLYGLDQLAARPDAPVLVCEGEKAADAAAKLFPDYIIVTSSGGANGADKTDWSPLADRKVVVWPDADEPGKGYAADVSRLVRASVIEIPEGFPTGWDLADDLPEGWNMEDLRRLLDEATSAPIEPIGFRMDRAGLWWLGGSEPAKIASRFRVLAETRDDHGTAWGLLIEWLDHDGRLHQWALPRALLAGDGSEVRQRFLDGGMFVAPSQAGRNRLTEYLLGVRTEARARCVDVGGWHGSAYVMPDCVHGDTSGERVILQTTRVAPVFTCRGSLDGWRNEVAALAVGNSRLALALSVAFVGPLLRLVGEESHGFHFSGGSSSGKTTALRITASVWGAPIHTWRTTDNAAEAWARDANDGLLLLDELSQVDGRAADAMAYMLGNGQGKGRMRRDITARQPASWRLVFMSSGEIGLAEKLGEEGKKAKAGQAVRLIEIPADAGAGHKLFESLHDYPSGDALARHLRAACERHQGHAAPAFLEHVTKEPAALADALRAEVAEWMADNLPPEADGQVARVASRFALAAVAGRMATDVGILPWPKDEATNAATVCFRAWLTLRGGVGAAEINEGIAQVQAFIEAHGTARFTPILGSETQLEDRTINRAGFRRRDDQGRWEYLVLPQAWTNEVCKGHDRRTVAKALIARGLLVPGTDGKAARQMKIPGVGNTRIYHLSANILAEGGTL